MELAIEFGKLLIPAAVVLYSMYLVMKSFIEKELTKQHMEIRSKSIETILPNRLHAYERVCLFLERISPANLVVRLNNGQYSAREFQQIILNEIREEYNHNVSQQMYMSEGAWNLVKSAKEDLILMVNDVMSGLPEDATSIDLVKGLFEAASQKQVDPIQHALTEVKNEIRQAF